MRCCSSQFSPGSTTALNGWLLADRFRRCACVLLVLAGFLGSSTWGNAAGTNGVAYYSSLVTACEAAQADQSLVLLIFEAEWCQPCQLLKRNVLQSEEFLNGAGNLKMIAVDVDADSKMAERFGVEEIPNLMLLSADRKIVARRTGSVGVRDLLSWIEQGRERAAHGQWEGAAPGAKMQEFVSKTSERGTLDTNELRQLVMMLDDSDPANRAAVEKVVLAQREAAMVPLIEALGHSYLGVRVEASHLLHKLAPEAPEADPWQAPADLAPTIASLIEWWGKTRKLPPAKVTGVVDATAGGSISKSIQKIQGDDLIARTEAMSALVNTGESALPAIRKAIGVAEAAGDRGAALALDEVRWAILIPDTLEKRVGSVRNVLARGSSTQRQGATGQLSRGGRDAIGALAELASDADPLVVENAVRALSQVGGKDAIPAMAALLKAPDSNLRMTAAQALGHTKSKEANAALIAVVDDPNEVVACTAISALEEINESASYGNKSTTPDDVVQALKRSLTDARWRVRTVAAETAAKVSAQSLTVDLKVLLNDEDGFVVKSAMSALRSLGDMPTPAELEDISKRLPSLRAETVSLMMTSNPAQHAKTIASIFESSSADSQLAILGAMMPERLGGSDKSVEPWNSVLTRAAAASDPRVRRRAAEVLWSRPVNQAAKLVGVLLSDEDSQTRIAAAQLVLRLAGDFPDVEDESDAIITSGLRGTVSKPTVKTNAVTPEVLASWHGALAKRPEFSTNLFVAGALYATGKGKADLSLLEAAVQKIDGKAFSKPEVAVAFGCILSTVPLAEGRAILEKLSSVPLLFAETAAASVTNEASVYLQDGARLKAALEPVSATELEAILPVLLSGAAQRWSLLKEGDRAQAAATAFMASTNAGLRAAAVHAISKGKSADGAALCVQALHDSDAQVRVEAVKGFLRSHPTRQKLEETVGPLLAETNSSVANIAALALLDTDVANASLLKNGLEGFEFGNAHVYASYSYSEDDRPLSAMTNKPAYLGDARARMADAGAERPEVFMLLLAQHGEFGGLDQLIQKQPDASRTGLNEALMTAVALSRDVKYLPYLRTLSRSLKGEYELRKLLRAIKGMNGPEVRQLRLDINKQIRTSTKE